MKQWNNPIGRILLYNTLFPSKISRNSPQVSLKITKWFHNYKRWNSVLNCGHWLIHLLAKLNFITFPSCILYQSQCTWYDLNCRHIDVIDKILQVKCIVVLYFQLYILHFFFMWSSFVFSKTAKQTKDLNPKQGLVTEEYWWWQWRDPKYAATVWVVWVDFFFIEERLQQK